MRCSSSAEICFAVAGIATYIIKSMRVCPAGVADLRTLVFDPGVLGFQDSGVERQNPRAQPQNLRDHSCHELVTP